MIVQEEIGVLRGRKFVYGILSAIFLGDFQEYNRLMKELPEIVRDQFPFHQVFEMDQVMLEYENLFVIPGDVYIPPYYSSYFGKGEEAELEIRERLLCLVGLFDRFGYFYPIDKGLFPDHIAMLFSFMQASISAEEEAILSNDTNMVEQTKELQRKFFSEFIISWIEKFLRKVQWQKESIFFQKMANYTKNFLNSEIDYR